MVFHHNIKRNASDYIAHQAVIPTLYQCMYWLPWGWVFKREKQKGKVVSIEQVYVLNCASSNKMFDK